MKRKVHAQLPTALALFGVLFAPTLTSAQPAATSPGSSSGEPSIEGESGAAHSESTTSEASSDETPTVHDESSTAPSESDTARRLPFAITEERHLSEEDLANKREGIHVTGIPELGYDPLNGFELGAEGYVTFNGSRDDPLFAYTPYMRRIGIEASLSTHLTRKFVVSYDEPYLFNTQWRLRAEAGYQVNPNLLYFGTTQNSLSNLGNLLPVASPYFGMPVSRFGAYEGDLATVRPGQPGEAADVADNLYDHYTLDETILNVSTERSFWESRMRVVAGYEVAFLRVGHDDGHRVTAYDPSTGQHVHVPNGTTRLTEDQTAGRIQGANGGVVTILQAGLVYDTRDLEPNPSHGIFAEVTNELSTRALGSAFTFDKLFGQIKFFQSILPRLPRYVASKLILAVRVGVGHTFGRAPFFEFADQWSTEGSIEGLGGMRTLRGYKQSRFMARTMAFANVELRYQFAETELWGNALAFMFLPFFDVGGVWDRRALIDPHGYRYAEGLGLRMIWDVSTVVSLDYAFSREDRQLFFSLGHTF